MLICIKIPFIGYFFFEMTEKKIFNDLFISDVQATSVA